MTDTPVIRAAFAVYNPVNGQRVLVVRNREGYHTCSLNMWESVGRGQTKQEAAAALAGSMFGWDCPGADPAGYDSEGRPLKGWKPKKA